MTRHAQLIVRMDTRARLGWIHTGWLGALTLLGALVTQFTFVCVILPPIFWASSRRHPVATTCFIATRHAATATLCAAWLTNSMALLLVLLSIVALLARATVRRHLRTRLWLWSKSRCRALRVTLCAAGDERLPGSRRPACAFAEKHGTHDVSASDSCQHPRQKLEEQSHQPPAGLRLRTAELMSRSRRSWLRTSMTRRRCT